MSKTFVGLLIATKLKVVENGEEEIVLLLQRRGKINTDSDYGFKWQSFSGLCEITSYGKASGTETPEQALEREIKEELGLEALNEIKENKLTKLYSLTEKDGDHVHVWGVLLNKDILRKIKLDISTGGIEILRRSDLSRVRYAKYNDEKQIVTDLNDIVIFEIPKDILLSGFDLN